MGRLPRTLEAGFMSMIVCCALSAACSVSKAALRRSTSVSGSGRPRRLSRSTRSLAFGLRVMPMTFFGATRGSFLFCSDVIVLVLSGNGECILCAVSEKGK